ncbi:hypothetical protein VNO77_14623 [Canavalia gladiata]|uniref:Uncharacterized protein n=1 Tax=Canavalia gladiata TaxID=3824 RepID=A0AAN9LZJ0_CANGL
MNNMIILLERIRELSAGISQQEHHIQMETLMNPLILNLDVNNLVGPRGMNVGQPGNQPITLENFASERLLHAISRNIEKLTTDHHFPLLDNWTYSQLERDIIGEPTGNLMHLCDVLEDLTMYGYGSDYFIRC